MIHVVTNGCFDGFGLHPGHLHLLAAARELGTELTVLVNSDASVRRLKGPDRPLLPLAERIKLLNCCRYVNAVVPFDTEDELANELRQWSPFVLVKGEDWRGRPITGAEFARRVEFVPLLPGWSTTEVLARLRSG